jgi:hypothetical protein
MLTHMARQVTLWFGLSILLIVLGQFVAINTLLFVLLAVLILGMLLVAFGTIVKNKWGLNFAPVLCPRCGSSLPKERQPRSRRQRLWGGCTCPACGTEVDKWGRELVLDTSK